MGTRSLFKVISLARWGFFRMLLLYVSHVKTVTRYYRMHIVVLQSTTYNDL